MELPYKKMEWVEACSDPTPAYFEEHFANASLPALIHNVANHWPAITKWTPEFFSKRYPDLTVTVTRFRKSEVKKMKMADFFSYMATTQDENPFYLSEWEFEQECPELMEDYVVPSYFHNWIDKIDKPQRPIWNWFYIGPAGTGSPMHVDVMASSAWNAVITGQKLWVFFPIDQLEFIYNGQINAFKPDFDAFPLLKNARPYYCVQNPGDIVFTPSMWWHQVYNAEDTISITGNFLNHTNVKDVESFMTRNNLSQELSVLQLLKKSFLVS